MKHIHSVRKCRKISDNFSKRKHFFLICLIFGCLTASFLPVNAQSAFRQYIEKYKEAAQRQQYEYGIPASITLAQGLLESAAGTSYLARNCNNHFGIKKSRRWDGDTVTNPDVKPSPVYRHYNTALDCYRDHSLFLLQKRYKSLFDLDITDYKGWAYGLRRCGYAEDPGYGPKLVRIIETYNLNQYVTDIPNFAAVDAEAVEAIKNKADVPHPKLNLDFESLHSTHRRWGLPYVKAMRGDTYERIAKEFNISVQKLKEYNDITDAHGEPKQGDIIYLENKQRFAPEGYDLYTVRKGDDLWTISQQFGVHVSSLMRLNSLQEGDKLHPGNQLKLRY